MATSSGAALGSTIAYLFSIVIRSLAALAEFGLGPVDDVIEC